MLAQLFLLSFIITAQAGLYLPGVSPATFQPGDPVSDNDLSTLHHQSTFVVWENKNMIFKQLNNKYFSRLSLKRIKSLQRRHSFLSTIMICHFVEIKRPLQLLKI